MEHGTLPRLTRVPEGMLGRVLAAADSIRGERGRNGTRLENRLDCITGDG